MLTFVRRALALTATLALLGAVATSAARFSGSSAWLAAVLVTFAPYALPAYVAALLVAAYVLLRRRGRLWLPVTLAVVGVLGAVVHTAWLVPGLTDDRAPVASGLAPGTALTVLSVNVYRGRADPTDLARVVREVDPDVLVLLEVDPPLSVRLDDVVPEGLARVAGTGAPADTQVFSRLPSAGTTDLGLTLAGWRTDLQVGEQVVRTYAVHPFNPVLRPADWRRDHRLLREAVLSGTGPALVVGDLNATLDHPPLRRFAAAGVRDAAAVAGEGWSPTFPVHPVVPRMIAIDHVLLRGDWVVREVGRHRVEGADHTGLSAELVLRGSAPRPTD